MLAIFAMGGNWRRGFEAEMTSFLGAETYRRNDVRCGWRNGYKPRTLKTRVG